MKKQLFKKVKRDLQTSGTSPNVSTSKSVMPEEEEEQKVKNLLEKVRKRP